MILFTCINDSIFFVDDPDKSEIAAQNRGERLNYQQNLKIHANHASSVHCLLYIVHCIELEVPDKK